MLRLQWGCRHRQVETGGIYRTIRRGISRGCPLSPLIGALYLNELDERMAATGLGYARFMDDWVILAPTRWKLRKAIEQVHQTTAELRLTLHPDKTSVGRTERGFDSLGYRLGWARVEVARPAVERMAERVTRLYEQGASERRIGDYVRGWLGWVNGEWKSGNE